MPQSKGRKKKKIKKAKKRSTSLDREVVERDGMQLIREGKNVFFNNTRTPEEHDAFIAGLKENRPLQLKAIEELIENIIKIFETYDNLKLLGGLKFNQLTNQHSVDDDGISALTLELGLSFSTAIPLNPSKEPTPSVINRLIKLLSSLRQGYNGYIMTENVTKKYSELESKLRFKTIIESLFVRGDGYVQHVYSLYKELFAAHDDILIECYGFSPNELLETFIQLEDSFFCRLVLPNGLPHPASHSRFVEWSKLKGEKHILSSGKHFIDLFGDENPDLIIENTQILSYRLDEIETYPELFKIRFRYDFQKLVVSTVAQNFGDNADFLNPKHKGLPLNKTSISTHPIIVYNDEYFLFSFSIPTRNIFEIGESLIEKASSAYYKEKFLGNKYAYSRDNFLEHKSAELFKKIIPDSKSFLNLKYKPGQVDAQGNLVETELDLLIISKTANYIIEMKAGGLSAPSKRGALKSLSGQLKDTIGYGAYQSFRATNFIKENDSPEFYDVKGNVIKIDKSKKIFRITITMEHLAGLIAYMYDLKELGIIDKKIDFAWTCSIFDLMIFSEIIENESDFIEYLEKRIPFYQRPELNFHDEIDILGHFLESGLNLDEDLIKGLTSFQLNNFSSDIDNYFEEGEPKPKRKKTDS